MHEDIFNQTKYTRWYFGIISNAALESRIKLSSDNIDYIYYEKHHILPKSLGGNDSIQNLSLLTSREHFICHLLLIKMCIHTGCRNKMIYAFNLLSHANDPRSQRRITGRTIQWAKERFIKTRSEAIPWNKGKRGIYSPEVRKKMGADKVGKINSAEYKLNMSKKLKQIQPSKKLWLVITPFDEYLVVNDRRQFCIDYNFRWKAVANAARSKKAYNGFLFSEIIIPVIV